MIRFAILPVVICCVCCSAAQAFPAPKSAEPSSNYELIQGAWWSDTDSYWEFENGTLRSSGHAGGGYSRQIVTYAVARDLLIVTLRRASPGKVVITQEFTIKDLTKDRLEVSDAGKEIQFRRCSFLAGREGR